MGGGGAFAAGPGARHGLVRNLHFVGAATRPGNGVPLVLISAEQTAADVLEDLEDPTAAAVEAQLGVYTGVLCGFVGAGATFRAALPDRAARAAVLAGETRTGGAQFAVREVR